MREILIECPWGKPKEDCPAVALRLMSIDERLKETDILNENQIDLIIRRHKECVEEHYSSIKRLLK